MNQPKLSLTGPSEGLVDERFVGGRICLHEELLHRIGGAVAAVVLPTKLHAQAHDDDILVITCAGDLLTVVVLDAIDIQVHQACPERAFSDLGKTRSLDDDVAERGLLRLGVNRDSAGVEAEGEENGERERDEPTCDVAEHGVVPQVCCPGSILPESGTGYCTISFPKDFHSLPQNEKSRLKRASGYSTRLEATKCEIDCQCAIEISILALSPKQFRRG